MIISNFGGERPAAKQARACRAGKHPLAYNLFVHIRNIILHQISAKISVFFRSIAEEKVSALPKRKLRGVTPVDVRTKPAVSRESRPYSLSERYKL